MKILALMAFFAIPILLGWEALVTWVERDEKETSDSP